LWPPSYRLSIGERRRLEILFKCAPIASADRSREWPSPGQKLAGQKTKRRVDWATAFLQAGRDPGIAGIESGIGPASPIPALPKPNGLAVFVQGVGFLDMVAKAAQVRRREVDREDGEFRVRVLIPDRLAEAVGQQDRALRAEERLEGDTGRERLSVSVIVAPTDLYISKAAIISARWPMASGNIRPFHGQPRVERSVVDQIHRRQPARRVRLEARLFHGHAG
jgi:hypothetical protein